MGIETAILIGAVGSTLLSADANIRAAEDEAEATVREGEINARNKAKETKARASRAKVSFLNSGLELQGTPLAAISGIFDSGLEDVRQISDNANARAKNILSAARAQTISSFAQMGMTLATSGMFSGAPAAAQPSSLGAGAMSPMGQFSPVGQMTPVTGGVYGTDVTFASGRNSMIRGF